MFKELFFHEPPIKSPDATLSLNRANLPIGRARHWLILANRLRSLHSIYTAVIRIIFGHVN